MVQMRIPTISEEYEPSGYGVCTTHLDIQVPCSRKVAGPVIPGVTATPLGKVSPTRGAVSVRLAGRSRRSVNGSKHCDGGILLYLRGRLASGTNVSSDVRSDSSVEGPYPASGIRRSNGPSQKHCGVLFSWKRRRVLDLVLILIVAAATTVDRDNVRCDGSPKAEPPERRPSRRSENILEV